MPHDRRTRRVLLAMVGLAGVAVSVGCMPSANLRSSTGSLPELTPAGELHPVPGGTTTGAASPTLAVGPGSPDRDSIAPSPVPTTNPGPNPGAPVAILPQGMPSANVPANAAASP